MVFLYNIFIGLYVFAIRMACLWNKKAGEWISGRKNLFEGLVKEISKTDRIIWIHCASAGELEQGKPIIEQFKKEYLSHKILISFFSPSGFNAAKKYQYADIITYLPVDTKKNAKKFVALINPELVIFIKYEFWYHHLSAIAFKHIPVLLVSAIFRKEQIFFKWYGKFYRQMLFLFRHIFVQDEKSLKLLKENNIAHCGIGGDTRFDRVKEIATNFFEVPFIKEFIETSRVIVAGSTWQDDEKILSDYVKNNSVKFIIAPHEINEKNLENIENLFSDAVRYSALNANTDKQKQTLIIDNTGMLSRLYQYATVTYVGGGFTKSGIHNTLEAAVYGKPVFFGPNYKKFKEAKELIVCYGAFSISNAAELKIKMDLLFNDLEKLKHAGNAAKNYVVGNLGATEKIIQFIQENRLLTN